MSSWNSNYGGSSGGDFQLVLDIIQISQNQANNTSYVRFLLRMHRTGGTAHVYNLTYSGTTSSVVITGETNASNNNYGYDFNLGVGSYVTLIDVYRTIDHNADGTGSASASASADADNSPYLTTASIPTKTLTLTTIPRYANIDSFTVTNATDESLQFNVDVDETCDQVEYSTDNGSSYTTLSGNFTSKSFTVSGLTAGTSYNCKVRVRRLDSGLKTTSSTVAKSTYSDYSYVQYDNANPYADGILRLKLSGGSWADVTSGDMYFKTYSAEGATTVTHSSQDPSTILKAVLDFFTDNGGSITYDGTSIDDTNTTASYTFKSQTCYEAIDTILRLAPEGWYWYIDPATNLLHFHAKPQSADHKFTLNKDVISLDFEKNSENIVNTIYFTGGDTGGGAILYKKYINDISQGLYGTRAVKMIDGRVTNATTAQTMANRMLNTYASPEVRLYVVVADSNVNAQGYDIETIKVGDTLSVLNDRANSGSSLWNVMIWNVDKWTYDISQLGTMNLQIVRIEYTPNEAVLYCSSIPPQIDKRISDIERNLEAIQTVDNADTPS